MLALVPFLNTHGPLPVIIDGSPSFRSAGGVHWSSLYASCVPGPAAGCLNRKGRGPALHGRVFAARPCALGPRKQAPLDLLTWYPEMTSADAGGWPKLLLENPLREQTRKTAVYTRRRRCDTYQHGQCLARGPRPEVRVQKAQPMSAQLRLAGYFRGPKSLSAALADRRLSAIRRRASRRAAAAISPRRLG